jgi:hypothetical protein
MYVTLCASNSSEWCRVYGPAADLPKWPKSALAKTGGSGVASAVVTLPNSIGYSVLDEATSRGLSCAALVNRAVITMCSISYHHIISYQHAHELLCNVVHFFTQLSNEQGNVVRPTVETIAAAVTEFGTGSITSRLILSLIDGTSSLSWYTVCVFTLFIILSFIDVCIVFVGQ